MRENTGGANGYGVYNSYYPADHVVIIVLSDLDTVFGTAYGFVLVGTIEGLTFSTA